MQRMGAGCLLLLQQLLCVLVQNIGVWDAGWEVWEQGEADDELVHTVVVGQVEDRGIGQFDMWRSPLENIHCL